MQPQSNQDYKQLLTEVIKKQIVILGPDITLSKARNVKGLTVADDGTVTDVSGSAQEVTQALIDQFVQLSGLIVKKTMEPLLAVSQVSPQSVQATATQAPLPAQPAPSGANTRLEPAPAPTSTPEQLQQAAAAQAVIEQAATGVVDTKSQPAPTGAGAQLEPSASTQTQAPQQPASAPSAPASSETKSQPAPTANGVQSEPAKNPLAA